MYENNKQNNIFTRVCFILKKDYYPSIFSKCLGSVSIGWHYSTSPSGSYQKCSSWL